MEGVGYDGGRPRCFHFFQEYLKCYTQNDHHRACQLEYEDYDECIFHKKEVHPHLSSNLD
jgi:NADH dehydrogenase (ubiquinone) Fe-S protein 5